MTIGKRTLVIRPFFLSATLSLTGSNFLVISMPWDAAQSANLGDTRLPFLLSSQCPTVLTKLPLFVISVLHDRWSGSVSRDVFSSVTHVLVPVTLSQSNEKKSDSFCLYPCVYQDAPSHALDAIMSAFMTTFYESAMRVRSPVCCRTRLLLQAGCGQGVVGYSLRHKLLPNP